MRFLTDDEDLGVVLQLDAEPAAVDLTAEVPGSGGKSLGEACLDAAVGGMITATMLNQAPDGTPWAEKKPSTLRAEQYRPGFHQLGRQTGDMLNPGRFLDGDREIQPREARWWYRHDGRGSRSWGKAHRFHNGADGVQVPRPLFGWTAQARETCRRLLAEARGE